MAALKGLGGQSGERGAGAETREPGVESRKTDRGCLYGWSQRVQGGKASEGSGSTQQGKAPKTSSSVARPAMGRLQGQPEVIHRPAPSMLADTCLSCPTVCLELNWAQQEGKEGQ